MEIRLAREGLDSITRLASLGRAVNERLETIANADGISWNEFRLLRLLRMMFHQAKSPKALAAEFGCSASQMSALLRSCMEKQLIYRWASDDDRRSQQVVGNVLGCCAARRVGERVHRFQAEEMPQLLASFNFMDCGPYLLEEVHSTKNKL